MKINQHKFNVNIEEKNPNKTRRIKELGPVDVTALLDKVSMLSPEDWERKTDQINENKTKILNSVGHITFKFSEKHPFSYYDLELWDTWKDVLLPVMDEVSSRYNYKKIVYPRVMLALLPSGAVIMPHSDGGMRFSRPHKIHVPLTTNKETLFLHPPDYKYHLEVGQAYEINNLRSHGGVNKGTTDRIHLIFEMIPIGAKVEKLPLVLDDR